MTISGYVAGTVTTRTLATDNREGRAALRRLARRALIVAMDEPGSIAKDEVLLKAVNEGTLDAISGEDVVRRLGSLKRGR